MLHLPHPSDDCAVQVLFFLYAVLFNGNEKAQEKMFHLLAEDSSNFFLRIYKLMASIVSRFGHHIRYM